MSKFNILVTLKRKTASESQKIGILKSKILGKSTISLPTFRLSLQIRVIKVVKHKYLKENKSQLLTLEPNFCNLPSNF